MFKDRLIDFLDSYSEDSLTRLTYLIVLSEPFELIYATINAVLLFQNFQTRY